MINRSVGQRVWGWKVWWLIVDWFDLPNLTTFKTGDESFYKVESVELKSMVLIHSYHRYSKLTEPWYWMCFHELQIESDREWYMIELIE